MCPSATCPGAHYRKHNHRCHRLLRELTYPEVPSLCNLSAMPSGTQILSFFSVILSMWEFLVRLVFCCTSKHQICISDLHFLTAFQWGTFLQWEGRERGKEAKGILLVKSAFLFPKQLCLQELGPTSCYAGTSCQVDQKLSHFSWIHCCSQQNPSSVSREKWKKTDIRILAALVILIKLEIKKIDI